MKNVTIYPRSAIRTNPGADSTLGISSPFKRRVDSLSGIHRRIYDFSGTGEYPNSFAATWPSAWVKSSLESDGLGEVLIVAVVCCVVAGPESDTVVVPLRGRLHGGRQTTS